MLKDLYIIGAGGFGREVAWLVERINQVTPTWNIVGFIDDDERKRGKEEGNYKVIGSVQYLANLDSEIYVVCAIGNPRAREKVIHKLGKMKRIRFATLVDPSVIRSSSVKIGQGTIICAGTILTVNITIGKHVIINLDCTIGHDAIISSYSTLYPSVNISGNCIIGENVEIGTGSQIIQGLGISDNTIIGAGSVVVRNITESSTYVGIPAKKIIY